MRKTSVVLAILFSLGVAAGAEAQGIGSALKKKVTQTVNPQTTAPARQAAPQGGSRLGFVLTDAAMQSLQKGMEIEIRMRQDYLDSLVGLKTQDEYNACYGMTQATPEMMAIQEEMVDRMDKATTQADMEKVMTWAADTMNVIVTKACGADPQPLYVAQKDEFKKAHDAGAAEFATVFPAPPPSSVTFWYSILPDNSTGAPPGAGSSRTASNRQRPVRAAWPWPLS